jgi:hypothetical protein
MKPYFHFIFKKNRVGRGGGCRRWRSAGGRRKWRGVRIYNVNTRRQYYLAAVGGAQAENGDALLWLLLGA